MDMTTSATAADSSHHSTLTLSVPTSIPKLSVGEKFAYGLGDFSANIALGTAVLFLSYFYIDIYGLKPEHVGIIMLLVRLVDAWTDALMGALADRTKSRYGRYRPWMLWMAVPFGVTTAAMFITPDWDYAAKFTYALGIYFISSLFSTATGVPYCSINGVMTNDPQDRVSCQTYRFVLAGCAQLIVSLAVLPLADYLGGGDKAKGFQLAISCAATLGVIGYIWCFAGVKERIVPPRRNTSMWTDFKEAFKDGQFRAMLLVTGLNVLPGFIGSGAVMFFTTWVMGQDSTFSSLYISSGLVAMMAGCMLAKPVSDRFCKLQVFFWVNIIGALLSFGFYFLDFTNIYLVTGYNIVKTIILSISVPLFWAIISDVDDAHELKTGNKCTGISFSSNLFCLKVGLALAGALVGFLLSYYDYDASAPVQNDKALHGIVMMVSIIPGVCNLAIAAAVKLLKVDRATMAKVQRELAIQRLNRLKAEQEAVAAAAGAVGADAATPAVSDK